MINMIGYRPGNPFKFNTPSKLVRICYFCPEGDFGNGIVIALPKPHLVTKYIDAYLKDARQHGDSYTKVGKGYRFTLAKPESRFAYLVPKEIRKFLVDKGFKNTYFFILGKASKEESKEAEILGAEKVSSILGSDGVDRFRLTGHCLRGR